MMHTGLEIERKYLIRMPDEVELRAMPGCVVWDVTQMYLRRDPDGGTRRIRRVCTGGAVKYFFTHKRRIDALSCEETEGEISEEEYAALVAQADPELKAVEKRRLRIPWMDQLLEVDIYRFWSDRATLEIELEREDQPVQLPDWLEIVRDVTGEEAYKNFSLARCVPMEDLGEVRK